MKKKVLVVGSINMDLVVTLDRMPAKGETVLGNAVDYIAGGKGSNQAYALGNLGGDVTMLGCVGNDSFGEAILNNLSGHGVNTDYIAVIDSSDTGMAFIYVDKDGNNSIVVNQGANAHCTVDYLKQNDDRFKEADYVLLQMEVPVESVEYAIKRSHELGKCIVLNPAPAPDSLSDSILRSVDYLTPNETETLKLGGFDSTESDMLETAAKELLGKGVKNLIITAGADGCYVYSDSDFYNVPTFTELKPIDTTAAGDCFNGAMVVGLSEGMTLEESLYFANAASSITVTRKGAQQSIPTRDETDRLILSKKH